MTSAAADPALARVWHLALAAREHRGIDGDAKFVIPTLSELEADALDALPWAGRPKRILTGSDLRVALSRFEAAVAASGLDVAEAYERFAGRAPRDLPAERATRAAADEEQRRQVRQHPVVLERPLLASAMQEKTVRVADVPSWLQALTVVASLPCRPPVERAVLSARLFAGDAHVLDADSRVEPLARELLEHLDKSASGARPPRDVWLGWGVELDPLSSTVLTLNLAAQGGSALGTALQTLHGSHAFLTLAQLRDGGCLWAPGDVFVCENPTVVRAVERRLGTASAPLVCTGGWPSAAAVLLLQQLSAAGSHLRHHGDFDWDGLAIHQALHRQHGVVPWRYDVDSYRTAVGASDVPLRSLGIQRRAADGPLADAFASLGQHVAEERVIEDLLRDLRVT